MPDVVPTTAYAATVRYGYMRRIGQFLTDIHEWKRFEDCILKTDRGTEYGKVLKVPSPVAAADNPDDYGQILRKATDVDRKKWRKLEEDRTLLEYEFCNKRIQARGLPMNLAAVEHLFGGEKIIFYFLADGRVDFRALVRDLARKFRTRIELRQIGVRDEAKLLGDVGHCGRELCCNTFLRELSPITMRMAKNQMATMDPAKISGVCGRLMCCLRYENETYKEMKKLLPRRGSRIETKAGPGEVTGYDILSGRVDVTLDGGEQITIKIDPDDGNGTSTNGTKQEQVS